MCLEGWPTRCFASLYDATYEAQRTPVPVVFLDSGGSSAATGNQDLKHIHTRVCGLLLAVVATRCDCIRFRNRSCDWFRKEGLLRPDLT